METNEISLNLEYEKRDENGKLEYEGISFVKDGFSVFLKQTISPIYKDGDYNVRMKEVAIDMTGFDSENLQAVFDTMPKVIQLIGVLVRDTNPNEMDLKNRYIDLKTRINGQHNVQLLAVYSNYKMKDEAWKKLI